MVARKPAKAAARTRRLAAHVYVDGVAYSPDSDVPDEVAEQITNPKAWADAPAESDESE